MTSYAIDPTQPLPRRWKDKNGPIRLMMTQPEEGFVMARRPNGPPFCIHVHDLLGGYYEPQVQPKRVNVRERVAEINAAHDRKLRELAGGDEG